MKTISLLFIALCFTIVQQAQVSKTVDLSERSLKNELTENELATITNLTLTGATNKITFQTINAMPLLKVLDISGLLIYEGYGFQSAPLSLRPHLLEGNAHLSTVILPTMIGGIGNDAFKNCTALSSITIPSSVGGISYGVFEGCKNLKSIYAYPSHPAQLFDAKTFTDVDKTICKLYVPFGAKGRYAAAEQWKDFKNIVEMPAFKVSATLKHFLAQEGGTGSIIVNSDADWTLQTDQTWLRINQTSGQGNSVLTFSTDANPSFNKRIAIVTVSFSESVSQNIMVYQPGIPKILEVTAGELNKLYPLYPDGEIDSTITNLILKGTMDARDFEAIRYQMPLLEVLDLSDVDIVAYNDGYGNHFQENEFPGVALEGNPWGSDKLNFVILPLSLTSIGESAFSWCNNLVSVIIPPQVTSIGDGAFSSCYNLTSITLPASVKSIGQNTFSSCFNLSSLTLPESVTSIGQGAFWDCNNLASINIPLSISSIGEYAFYFCKSLTSIFVYSKNPVDLNSTNNVFQEVDKTSCKLYVPYGSKMLYSAANQWKDFKNIIEIPGFLLSADNVNIASKEGSQATVKINSYVAWTATSDQSWLTLSPTSGTIDETLTFTADANLADHKRTATVTFTAEGVDPQIIIIIQDALTTGVAEMTQNKPSFTCYPNPFTNELTIEIQNPKHIKLTVDIYNLAGQRVKNLAIGNPSEQLNLSWDGTNEIGQKVPIGVYICRMNHQSKQLIYRGRLGSQ